MYSKYRRVTETHLRVAEGLPIKSAVKEGWKLGLQVALAPVLPVWLYKLTSKVLLPVLTQYTTIKVNRAVVDYHTNKQGKKLKGALSQEQYQEAFNALATIP